MVTTRNNTSTDDAPAQPSPTKRVTRTSTANGKSSARSAKSPTRETASPPATPTRTRAPTSATLTGWSHTPSNLTLIWLVISLPLVVWDTGYVLLRPHSMPGGKFHKPLWIPYELYGTVDYVYGFKALESNNGWTAAQGWVNALETAAYGVYLYIVYKYGEQEPIQGRGAPDKSVMGQLRALSESRTLSGKYATGAVLLAYSTAFLTFWKTVLYWLLEAFGGFHNIGHNDLSSLIFLWIIPNGAWLIFPAYMMYVFGSEILQGLEVAANSAKKTR
ncbi:hypothetical protein AC579_4995 [Pseudocercospora musae]|uniref:EXPERA domain-containing protein n=1 Tax=Pseudocercospora musae TaxID=113226 RepID=A0A139IGG8_9PEZI|nr:hypothetical protein AC579_4995 [Pseudocercospora musae]